VRIWNIVPDINRGSGDEETYVLFNKGRKAAFDLMGFAPSRYPAATGVGGPPGSPLTVIVAASRTEPVALENPRQTSAYLYPRRYGPRSPAFARAMLLRDRGGATLFISGTASIVGHESQHRGIRLQLKETLTNLEQLLVAATRRMPGCVPGARRHWQVYLRDPADLAAVQDEVHAHLARGQEVAFLQADICRRELLVEIEGVCELTRTGTPPGA
jgi:chorismate lyase/3-hydroxybenzoate synthase